MNEDRSNKIKTTLVITIFIIIILLSAYIVIDKVSRKEKIITIDDVKINKVDKDSNNKVDNYIETVKYNEDIEKLNNYIDDFTLKRLYKYKNKELDFGIKSYITTRFIDLSDKVTEEIWY